jgi:hypothetical protein
MALSFSSCSFFMKTSCPSFSRFREPSDRNTPGKALEMSFCISSSLASISW